jgi:hypothetical protein
MAKKLSKAERRIPVFVTPRSLRHAETGRFVKSKPQLKTKKGKT